jgi:hypothetical protein
MLNFVTKYKILTKFAKAADNNNREVQISNGKGQLFRSMGTRIHVIETGKA